MYFDAKIDSEGMEIVCEIHGCGRTATHPEYDDGFFDDRDLCPEHMDEAILEEVEERKLEAALDARAWHERFEPR